MTDEQFSGRLLPLAVGVARGVRAFDVDKQGRLVGVTFRKAWRPGENVAECYRGQAGVSGGVQFWYSAGGVVTASTPKPLTPGRQEHDMSSCQHGLYAYYDGSNDYSQSYRISGVIEGYGECLIGTRGFRASKARIVALHMQSHRPVRRWLWRWTATALAAVLAGLFGGLGVLILSVTGDAKGWINVGVGAMWFLVAVFEGLRTRSREDSPKGVAPELQTLVRRNYPDVPIFDSFAAMVRVFPPDRSLASTPESDDQFWERAS